MKKHHMITRLVGLAILAMLTVQPHSTAQTSQSLLPDLSDQYLRAKKLREQENEYTIRAAVTILQQLVVRFQELGKVHDEGLAYHELSFCFDNLGEPARALEASLKAVAIFRTESNSRDEAAALTEAGMVYTELGQFQPALDALEVKALPIRRELRDLEGEAATLNALGVLYINLGSYDHAISVLQASLNRAEDAGSNIFRAAAYGNLGFVHFLNQQYEPAQSELKRALDLFRDHQRGRAFVLNNLGRLEHVQGNDKQASSDFEQAAKAAQTAGAQQIRIIILHNQAVVALDNKNFKEARDLLTTALFGSREAGFKEVEARCLGTMMQTLAMDAQLQAAVFYGKQAVLEYQWIRLDLRTYNSALEREFIGTREGTYRSLADILVSVDRLPEAQQIIHLLKEDEVWTYTRGSHKTSEANPQSNTRKISCRESADQSVSFTPSECDLAKKYEEISQDAAEVGRRYYELHSIENPTDEQKKSLDVAYTQVLAVNQHFQLELRKIESELGTAGIQKIREIKESQSLMQTLSVQPEDAVVVYTLTLPTKLRIILITPIVQITHEVNVTATQLNRDIFLFREQLQDRNSDPKVLGKKLYDIVFAPIAQDVRKSKAKVIMWSLDGALRYIPMSALYDGSKYLAEQYSSVLFTPASRDSLRESVSPTWVGTGFGVSKSYPGFAALPGVAKELDSIFGGANGATSTNGMFAGSIFLDEKFTRENMLSNLGKKQQLVHIASHFQLNPASEDQSYLLMGNGTHFTLRDMSIVPNLFGGTELLTLSACETGVLSRRANGVEVESLGVLAQRQGAAAVISTLWKVADRSTAEFMLDFYQEKKNHTTKATALRDAQLELMRSGFAHPFFWAPYVLYGNWK